MILLFYNTVYSRI